MRESADLAWAEPNRGHLIYEHQVKAELLDYGYALHRRIAEQALAGDEDVGRLLRAQEDLAGFEWAVQDASHFTEIRDLLQRGWEALGVPTLRVRVMEGLRARQERAAHRAAATTNRWGLFIALVAGLLAVPPLADAVLAPLWEWRDWWRPADASAAKLMLVGIAVVLVALLFGAGFVWARGRPPRS